MDGPLASRNETAAWRAIERFVESVTDGTLWCEKPTPIERGFILERFAEMAERDGSLRVAEAKEWTVVSIKNDWATVFADGVA